jgi:hypothetical protein
VNTRYSSWPSKSSSSSDKKAASARVCHNCEWHGSSADTAAAQRSPRWEQRSQIERFAVVAAIAKQSAWPTTIENRNQLGGFANVS